MARKPAGKSAFVPAPTGDAALDALLKNVTAPKPKPPFAGADATAALRGALSPAALAALLPPTRALAEALPARVELPYEQYNALAPEQRRAHDRARSEQDTLAAALERCLCLLASSGDEEAEQLVLALARTQPDPVLRRAAMRALLGEPTALGPRDPPPPLLPASASARLALAGDFERLTAAPLYTRGDAEAAMLCARAALETDAAAALERFAPRLTAARAELAPEEHPAAEPAPSPASCVLYALAWTPAALDPSPWRPHLEALWRAPRRAVRCAALAVLARFPDASLAPSLAELLREEDGWLRTAALHALRASPTPALREPALSWLAAHPRDSVGAMSMVQLLGLVADPPALRSLAELLPVWGAAMASYVALELLEREADARCLEALRGALEAWEFALPQWDGTPRLRALARRLGG